MPNSSEIIFEICKEEVSTLIRQLLEEKHLYQSLRLNEDIVKSIAQEIIHEEVSSEVIEMEFNKFTSHFSWKPPRNNLVLADHIEKKPNKKIQSIEITFPHIKSYCENCKGYQAFKMIFCQVFSDKKSVKSDLFQHFLVIYECSYCENYEISFLIFREDEKITLVGRSQFGFKKPAPILPNEEEYSQLISRAQISYDAHYYIAALSYLRLFIEKYVRNETGIFTREESQNISDICEEYSQSLPVKLRSVIPSLKSIYEQLSAAYHQGDLEKINEYGTLYEQCLENLKKHFHGIRAI